MPRPQRFTSLNLLKPATSIAEILALISSTRAGETLSQQIRVSHLSLELVAIPDSLRIRFRKSGYNSILPAACVRQKTVEAGLTEIKIYFDDQAPLILAASQLVHELTHALEPTSVTRLEAEWTAHLNHLRFTSEIFRKFEDVQAVLNRKFSEASHLWNPISRAELAQRYRADAA